MQRFAGNVLIVRFGWRVAGWIERQRLAALRGSGISRPGCPAYGSYGDSLVCAGGNARDSIGPVRIVLGGVFRDSASGQPCDTTGGTSGGSAPVGILPGGRGGASL